MNTRQKYTALTTGLQDTQKFRVFPVYSWGAARIVYAVRQPGCSFRFIGACNTRNHRYCRDYPNHAMAMRQAQRYAADHILNPHKELIRK